MIDSLYLGWRHVSFYRVKTLTLVACITLIAVLPMMLQLLLVESERQLLARAVSTPLVVGAKGSALDLMMSTLYFGDEAPEPVSMATSERIWATDLALPIPVHVRFEARDHPIVGTTLDYFDFRGLDIVEGRGLAVLGDCVLGAEAAEHLGLEPGDSLISSPQTLFDLAGAYPLKMTVVGVLQRSHSADDLAVFVDLKTAWVIEGLGHGHEDLTRTGDDSVVLERTEDDIVANAKLVEFTEITEENLSSFHFHGDAETYPVTAVIAVPHDVKSGTILRGRYLARGRVEQIVVPEAVIDRLLQNIFRIKNVLDAVVVIVGLATVLALILVFALSLRLRQREIQTIFQIGCRRMTIARMLAAEIVIVLWLSAVACGLALMVADRYTSELVRALFIR